MYKMDAKYLIKKLFDEDKISPEEFEAYKKITESTNKQEIDSILGELWGDTNQYPEMDENIKRETLDILLQNILSMKKKRLSWVYRVAMIALPLIISLSIYLYLTSTRSQPIEYYTIVTGKGQKSQLVLPDNTIIWLNSETEIRYPSNYNKDNRKVVLKGNAFFEVTKNTKSKFIVETGDLDILVHGTEFNVNSRADSDQLTVALVSGKVSILKNDDQSILTDLIPGQMAKVNKKSRSYTVEQCDSELESLWKNDILKFEGLKAKEMFKRIGHWYGVEITVENMDESISYGLTIKSESLKETLELLNLMRPFKYTINGEEVHIKYR